MPCAHRATHQVQRFGKLALDAPDARPTPAGREPPGQHRQTESEHGADEKSLAQQHRQEQPGHEQQGRHHGQFGQRHLHARCTDEVLQALARCSAPQQDVEAREARCLHRPLDAPLGLANFARQRREPCGNAFGLGAAARRPDVVQPFQCQHHRQKRHYGKGNEQHVHGISFFKLRAAPARTSRAAG